MARMYGARRYGSSCMMMRRHASCVAALARLQKPSLTYRRCICEPSASPSPRPSWRCSRCEVVSTSAHKSAQREALLIEAYRYRKPSDAAATRRGIASCTQLRCVGVILLYGKITRLPRPEFCPHVARRRSHLHSRKRHFLITFGWTRNPSILLSVLANRLAYHVFFEVA